MCIIIIIASCIYYFTVCVIKTNTCAEETAFENEVC